MGLGFLLFEMLKGVIKPRWMAGLLDCASSPFVKYAGCFSQACRHRILALMCLTSPDLARTVKS